MISPRQREVLAFCASSSYWVSCEGAIRSGKSHAAMLAFLIYTQSEARTGQHHFLAGRTMTSLRRNVLDPMRRTVESLGGKWGFSRLDALVTVNGVEYSVFGANDDAAQDRLQGLTAGSCLLDEAARLPMSFVEQSRARTSFRDSKVFSTLNPEGPRHPLREMLIRGQEAGDTERLRFSLDDNPVLAEEVKDRYRRSFSGVWYARFIAGEWAAAAGAIWPDVVEAGAPADRKFIQYDLGIDYASSGTFAAVLVARFRGGADHVLREWYRHGALSGGMSDSQLADGLMDEFGAEFRENRIGAVFCDPSAASFRAELRRRGVSRIRKGWNDVLSGIRVVGARFRQGLLTIDHGCSNLLGEVYSYQWDEKAQAQGQDRPVKAGDHGCDALRYVVGTRYRYAGDPGARKKPEGW